MTDASTLQLDQLRRFLRSASTIRSDTSKQIIHGSVGSFWVRGFRAIHAECSALPVMFELGEVHVRVGEEINGWIEQIGIDPNAIRSSSICVVSIPPGQSTLLIAPHHEAEPDAEAKARRSLDQAEAVIATFGSRRLVYERIFENYIDTKTDAVTIYGTPFLNPAHIREPNLEPTAIEELTKTYTALAQTDAKLQRKRPVSDVVSKTRF
jgi:hypothetical protein